MRNEQTIRARLINKLKEHYQVERSNALANQLSATDQKRAGWNTKIAAWPKDPKPLSHTEILNLVKDAVDAAIKREREKISKEFIKPLVEYFPIEKVESKHGKNYEISPPDSYKKEWGTLRKDLQKAKSGIYIFYDSSGRAIYIGKTAGTTITLWARMKLSFNHDQQKSRQLYRIDHSPKAKTQDQKLGPKPVQLHELAKYFSAYEVEPHMVHNVEALLIRAFADNLMNKKMETFKS